MVQRIREFFEEIIFLGRSYRILKNLDLLVITGSNQFLDNFGGPWAFPYTLLKWSVLAKLAGTKVYFVSVGAGPIRSSLSKMFIKWSLFFSDYTSFRDEASKRMIEEAGYQGNGCIYPDLAHSLDVVRNQANRTPWSSCRGKPVIGINPMPLYDSRYWCVDDETKYFGYVKEMGAFSSLLLKEGYPVFFFGTQLKDEDVIKDIFERLDDDLTRQFQMNALIRRSHSVQELMMVIDSADIVVATRFHGTVLSLLAGKPVLAICYYRKTDDLMKEMGQADYSMKFDSLDAGDLLKRFRLLEVNLGREVEKIRKKSEEYRDALREEYDFLFGAAERRTSTHLGE